MILKNCTFINEGFEKEYGDIRIENGRIAEIGILPDAGKDMSGRIIIPGMVDIHIHGGGGGDASDGTTDALDKISAYLAKRGVTSFCPTTMTLPMDRLADITSVIAGYRPTGAKVVGINLEGPFINSDKRGAQNIEYVTTPGPNDIDTLVKASTGMVKIITIAPEAFNSDAFIKKATDAGITVAIGHSNADADACRQAIENGAKHITHLYNAMTPMTHRSAGIVGTALDNDGVTCELICDGEHICPAVLRNTFKILGDSRAVVVSDSMRGAGLGNGEYELGGQTTYVRDGYRVARLADGTIAASITNVFDEFKNLLSYGIDLRTALMACTINPARVIGMDEQIGSIAVGKAADMIVVDENMELIEVYIDGALA